MRTKCFQITSATKKMCCVSRKTIQQVVTSENVCWIIRIINLLSSRTGARYHCGLSSYCPFSVLRQEFLWVNWAVEVDRSPIFTLWPNCITKGYLLWVMCIWTTILHLSNICQTEPHMKMQQKQVSGGTWSKTANLRIENQIVRHVQIVGFEFEVSSKQIRSK